ncbi:MAG: flagellar assembly protein FliH [Spirochaetia bacterium]|nr:flagellar assembly protein FliH [Spirochaetia bacterium]
MGKTVFRPSEINSKQGEKVTLKLIHDYSPQKDDESEKIEEYTGPTPDELRREAEAFKAGWEIEKQHLLSEAQKQADEIIKKAEDSAFEIVKKNTDEVQVIKNDASIDAEKIISDAKQEAEKIISEAKAQEEFIKSQAEKTGYDAGYKDGFSSGEDEQNLLIGRIHKIIESIMKRREEILKETESQIVELILLMTRKVVKVISENQKQVLANNILSALNKVRSKGEVILRVNLDDVKIAAQNLSEFTKRVENVSKITVVEDSTVEKGGCIVETDFGEIDATIHSQLHELEEKILEVSPIKSVPKKTEKS